MKTKEALQPADFTIQDGMVRLNPELARKVVWAGGESPRRPGAAMTQADLLTKDD